jgi:Transposase DDE domain group 1
MQAEWSADLFGFAPVERRAVVAGFDGGRMTSDAGALLLGATDRAISLVERFADCCVDSRAPELIEHTVGTMVGQRVFALALGCEDLIDHDQPRHDPTLAVLAGKLAARRQDCAPLAGKSTLNRLELGGPELTRYHRIAWDGAKIEAVFVELFLDAHRAPPQQIIVDLDATEDPLHGHQEGRFFHGYYDGYCYLPLYIFCGPHLLAAKQRPANIDASAGAIAEVARIVAQIRARWAGVRIVLRADSGFAREALMTWCELNSVDFLFGLAKNRRLVGEIASELAAAEQDSKASDQPARRFKEFPWSTRDSRSRQRRVIAKAEWTGGAANPRFVVTSLSAEDAAPQRLYEEIYCARGDMENRIKGHGKSHQGVSARPVRRPHFGGHDARQPAAAVVCFDGLCAAVRAAPLWRCSRPNLPRQPAARSASSC